MQIRISLSMGSITITSSYRGCSSGNGGNGLSDPMKVKIPARGFSYRMLFHTILFLAFILPFVFILTALITLEGVNNCSFLDCLGRRLGPRFLRRGDHSTRPVSDLYKIFKEIGTQVVPVGTKLPESFSEFLSDMKNNQYDAKTFAVRLKATVSS